MGTFVSGNYFRVSDSTPPRGVSLRMKTIKKERPSPP